MIKNSTNKISATIKGWRLFGGIRPRILVWYFLLTAASALISIQVTRQIYCDRLKTQSEASLVREIERFNQFQQQTAGNTAAIFAQFLANYAPTPNEYIITLLNDNIYKTSPQLPPQLQNLPKLIRESSGFSQPQTGRLYTSTQRIIYVVQPVSSDATIIAIRDATADYQAGTNAIFLVIQVMLVVLSLFFILAWISAGRVLSPLRLLTKTAQSITESDMTQRISVKGSDEIAELSLTFNEMLDRLQFAFDSQQEFLKDAGHELRTPITVIQGHLDMLKYQPEKQLETIDLVMDELERMSRLVNDLLLLAKAERPDFLHLKPEELDWLTEELYLKSRTLADRDWRLESKGLSPVLVDRQRLTQAVMNLVQNAVRHTSPGDTITLGSSVKADLAYIWVRDTGVGIAPADQKRIFERFVQITPGETHLEGHGLGLSIVEAIAQGHGGTIELCSRLGHGSTFTLVIPLSPQNVTAHEPDSHRRRQPAHHLFPGNWTAGARIHNHSR